MKMLKAISSASCQASSTYEGVLTHPTQRLPKTPSGDQSSHERVLKAYVETSAVIEAFAHGDNLHHISCKVLNPFALVNSGMPIVY